MARISTGPNYNSYVKAYKAKEQQLHKKGLSMRDSMFTKSEFEFAYKLERQQMTKLVKEGKRKVVGNITQNLVSEQSYEMSLAQARGLRRAYGLAGINISISAIRENTAKAQEASHILGDIYHSYVESESKGAGLFREEYFGS